MLPFLLLVSQMNSVKVTRCVASELVLISTSKLFLVQLCQVSYRSNPITSSKVMDWQTSVYFPRKFTSKAGNPLLRLLCMSAAYPQKSKDYKIAETSSTPLHVCMCCNFIVFRFYAYAVRILHMEKTRKWIAGLILHYSKLSNANIFVCIKNCPHLTCINCL